MKFKYTKREIKEQIKGIIIPYSIALLFLLLISYSKGLGMEWIISFILTWFFMGIGIIYNNLKELQNETTISNKP